MNNQEAYQIASQWGRCLSFGDPGACFYGFYLNDATPAHAAHKAQCLAYTKTCISRLETGVAMGTTGDNDEAAQDLDDLKALLDFFEQSEPLEVES
jgi:hypothetical protein